MADGNRRFVLDASVTLTWCFGDEQGPYGLDVLTLMATWEALVPPVWYLEVANVLVVAERRGRLTPAEAEAFMGNLSRVSIAPDTAGANETSHTVMGLARAHALSAYDAAYLELALREGLPIATADRALRAAMARLGVPLLAIAEATQAHEEPAPYRA